VMMEASTMRKLAFMRPGVGSRSRRIRSIHADTAALMGDYLTIVTAVEPMRKSTGSGSSIRTRTGNLAERWTQLRVSSMLDRPPTTLPSSVNTPYPMLSTWPLNRFG
jgi:hypothetical protein